MLFVGDHLEPLNIDGMARMIVYEHEMKLKWLLMSMRWSWNDYWWAWDEGFTGTSAVEMNDEGLWIEMNEVYWY